MPHHEERKYLPYSPEQMFDLVADVASYPQFLPWLVSARVYDQRDNSFQADLIVGFKVFKERFTSKVQLEPKRRVQVNYIRGPLRYLHNEWIFHAVEGGGCAIDFCVDFEFKNHLFERLAGAVFTEAVSRMVKAFEQRADRVYAKPDAPKPPSRSGL
ncbi:ubiquinone-binding protein [Iodidimonas nitroreducens]|uniref:Ubiquinone-binding protein n=1 Tax=Iodidimonas nitroreducens TaxID=1236968 RepID=A0A5A7N451_9PROT|nr:type II toxin-antitoxin system RatA family toxin [Iodidimonas nitroreducens]GAK32891.1 ribosome association toxin RatA [alpha proteobacterium Q-1]GER03053.1 ubiquinone-binding protein [Iodidimonas nitroreducens]